MSFLPRETIQHSAVPLAILFPGLEEQGWVAFFSPFSSVGLLSKPLAHLGMAPGSSLKKVTGVNVGISGTWMIPELRRGEWQHL